MADWSLDPDGPAWAIPLSNKEFQLIGEICAIQGQIEYLMVVCVQKLLEVSDECARTIMSSTTIANNAQIWLTAVREKSGKPDLISVAETATKEMRALAEGRNDFVHAVYAHTGRAEARGITLLSFRLPPNSELYGRPVAVRVRNKKQTDPSELERVRAIAIKVNRMVAHISWELQGGASPWRDKL
ncbi:MAG: hypothetical protein ING44_12025 [Telmatospirillum sp.]|nr:hypothetical protein [Telmatospirillum sp.]